jgi:hypothetical protein
MWSLFFKPNDEKLYLICSSNQKPVYNSSDMGETWELAGNNAFSSDAQWSVCAGRAIAVGDNELRLSYNMFDYDRISFPKTDFLAVAEDKKIILGGHYYYQNSTWSPTNLPSGLDITSCCYGKDIFLVSLSGYNIRRICYGTDCQTWTLLSIPNDMSGEIKYSERLSKFFCGKYSSLDGINWTMTTEENIARIIAVIDTPNSTWLYGMSSGSYLKKSSDGITWADSGIYVNSPDICYCDKQNLVYIVDADVNPTIYVNNPETNVYTPRNFISGESLAYLAWSKEKNMFMGTGGIVGAGGVYSKIYSYMSYDGINWQRIPSSTISDYVYVKFLGDFIGTNSTVIKFVGEENIINALSEDSTMNFELENGENKFRWSSSAGDGIGTISYRQKYLGV